jgi:mannose-1-phosphate guanylyltransferase
MKAVVLVGGFGTRLRPLTLTTPKQMLPILHKPMIEHVLEHLAGFGIDEAVLSMGYRPDAFTEAYPENLCAGVKVHYAIEPEPLDTAGAIRFAALDAGIDERFVVVNGDVLTDLDLAALIARHDERGAEGTIALHPAEDPSRYGVVPTADDGRVLAFVEKPPRDEAPTNLINAGTYVLEASVLGRIDAGRKVSVEREVFPAMVADQSLYAFDGQTYWIDTGTPAEYLQAQLDLLDGVRGPAEDGIDPTALIEGDVTGSAIGAGARVLAGATVERSAVMAGAIIRPGATVRGSVVGPDAVVGEGATLDHATVIGDGVTVPAGATLSGARVPEPA